MAGVFSCGYCRGCSGLGETFRHVGAVNRYLHEHVAPYLLGKDPCEVNRHAHALREQGGQRFLGYPTRSVETRANSAVDIALWDLKAHTMQGVGLGTELSTKLLDHPQTWTECSEL